MKQKRPSRKRRSTDRVGSTGRTIALAAIVAAFVAMAVAAFHIRSSRKTAATKTPGHPTYHRDIAPIFQAHCASCHQPGQAAPFPLLGYADARKRARDIRELVQSRAMPPWLPSPDDGPFVGQRSLTREQIAVITRWVDQGAVEGKPSAAAPGLPRREEWQLGTPDLIIRLPQAYPLRADGPDLYRNFVIPIPVPSRRFVKGVELDPGNRRIVHHAFMRIDNTAESARRDALEPGAGFAGLHAPPSAQTPEGQFLSWQPGKLHTFTPRGLAWTLEPESDLVLQMHLRPSGKPEMLQPAIAFYFTDEAPTNTPFKIGFRRFDLDIPADASNHVASESYTLAADVELLSILPHAHYLGHRLEALATLPDGRREPLLRIANWDFNWQGDYLLARPRFLPRGTTISMEWHYDNSIHNPRNPHNPPQRVRYGLQSSDEMAELWLQVLPRDTNGLAALAAYDRPRVFRDAIAYNEYLLGQNPQDARAHSEIGKARLFLGDPAQAEHRLREAIALDPNFDEPHYFLGLKFRMENKLSEAASEFAAAVRLNPGNAKAQGNLGLVLMDQGALDMASTYLNNALRLNPEDSIAKEVLQAVERMRAAQRRGP
jgi:tetratricopeptide (TPR) repeat protein/mono/diheme cytochrome c family protein